MLPLALSTMPASNSTWYCSLPISDTSYTCSDRRSSLSTTCDLSDTSTVTEADGWCVDERSSMLPTPRCTVELNAIVMTGFRGTSVEPKAGEQSSGTTSAAMSAGERT